MRNLGVLVAVVNVAAVASIAADLALSGGGQRSR